MIVTTQHLFTIPYFADRPGFCRGRAKDFFASHGLDWRRFVREGIDERELLDCHDALSTALVRWAHQCAAAERGNNGR